MTRVVRHLGTLLWALFVANLAGVLVNLAANNPQGIAFHIKGALAAGAALYAWSWLS